MIPGPAWSRGLAVSVKPLPAAVAAALLLAATACRSGAPESLGPPDSFVLLGAGPATSRLGLPIANRLEVTSEAAAPIARPLADGFPGEVLRTVYLAKQFVRDVAVGGRRCPEPARATAAEPVLMLVGADAPSGRGLALRARFGSTDERPAAVWLGIPRGYAADRALGQSLSGRLAALALATIACEGPATAAMPRVLADGYRMFVEVVAREWRVGTGPQGVMPHDAGTEAQRQLFADVRENRFVTAASGSPRPAAELLAEPGVTATVLYRLAQSRGIARRGARPEFYAPFVSGRVPEGVSPAAVLGPFRNFQAKLLGAWGRALLRGQPPRDLPALLDAYAAEFPGEKDEALRVFVVTTFGATIKPGGVSTLPAQATAALAEMDGLLADVLGGKRALRDAADAARHGDKP